MISAETKDQVNGLLSLAYSEIRRLIQVHEYDKAESLAYAFSLIAPRGEDGNYDWYSVLLPLNAHYAKHSCKGMETDFLKAFDALRKAS